MKTDETLRNKFDEYFRVAEDNLVQDLSRLISINSVKGDALPGMPFGSGPAKALDLALTIAKEKGFITKNFDNYVGTVDLNTKETQLGILCHLDVVGEGSGWSTDPYAAILDDGIIYGRGVSDDKGPAVAALFAMKAVKDLEIPLSTNARLILGTDEESGSSDIEYYFKQNPVPPNIFSPDGDFPIYNTEKGFMRLKLSQQWESSNGLPRVVAAKGGFRINVIPPEAEAAIEGCSAVEIEHLSKMIGEETHTSITVIERGNQVIVHVTGKNEHASTPEKGCNAVTALLDLLVKLPLSPSLSFTAIQQLQSLFPHGDYYGKALGIAQSDEISGPLTASLDIFSLDENGFTAEIDSRTPLCANKQNALDIVSGRSKQLGFHMEGHMSPPHHTPPESNFIQTLISVYERYTGLPGSCQSTGGGSYVHGIPGGVCFGANFPGFTPNIHGPNERIPVRDLIAASKIFAQVIVDLCS